MDVLTYYNSPADVNCATMTSLTPLPSTMTSLIPYCDVTNPLTMHLYDDVTNPSTITLLTLATMKSLTLATTTSLILATNPR